MTEYSVEESSTLPMKSSAVSALPTHVLSKSLICMSIPSSEDGARDTLREAALHF